MNEDESRFGQLKDRVLAPARRSINLLTLATGLSFATLVACAAPSVPTPEKAVRAAEVVPTRDASKTYKYRLAIATYFYEGGAYSIWRTNDDIQKTDGNSLRITNAICNPLEATNFNQSLLPKIGCNNKLQEYVDFTNPVSVIVSADGN